MRTTIVNTNRSCKDLISALLLSIAVTWIIGAMKTLMKSKRKANQTSTKGIDNSFTLHCTIHCNTMSDLCKGMSYLERSPTCSSSDQFFHNRQTEYTNRSLESDIGLNGTLSVIHAQVSVGVDHNHKKTLHLSERSVRLPLIPKNIRNILAQKVCTTFYIFSRSRNVCFFLFFFLQFYLISSVLFSSIFS